MLETRTRNSRQSTTSTPGFKKYLTRKRRSAGKRESSRNRQHCERRNSRKRDRKKSKLWSIKNTIWWKKKSRNKQKRIWSQNKLTGNFNRQNKEETQMCNYTYRTQRVRRHRQKQEQEIIREQLQDANQSVHQNSMGSSITRKSTWQA